MAYSPEPTLAGFISFIRNVMQISADNLPDNAAVISYALSFALARVNPALNGAGYAPGVVGTQPVSWYTTAVYNLGGDGIINYAPDPVAPGDTSYFTDLRTKMNIGAFVSGVISSAGDEGTNESMVTSKAFENLTMFDLQNLKTPYGRQYLAIAQMYGPSIVGLS